MSQHCFVLLCINRQRTPLVKMFSSIKKYDHLWKLHRSYICNHQAVYKVRTDHLSYGKTVQDKTICNSSKFVSSIQKHTVPFIIHATLLQRGKIFISNVHELVKVVHTISKSKQWHLKAILIEIMKNLLTRPRGRIQK